MTSYLHLLAMAPRTTVRQWIWALIVMAIGAAISIPLGRHAEADDAPGGVVIATLIFVAAAVVAIRIVSRRPKSAAPEPQA